jgi:hypothetical protein
VNLPTVQPEREPITVLEAIRLGQAAGRHHRYGEAIKTEHGGGCLSISVKGGVREFPLISTEVDALLSLLIEREAAFLTPFNVEMPQ